MGHHIIANTTIHINYHFHNNHSNYHLLPLQYHATIVLFVHVRAGKRLADAL